MIDAVEEIIDENPRPSPSAIIVLVSVNKFLFSTQLHAIWTLLSTNLTIFMKISYLFNVKVQSMLTILNKIHKIYKTR